MNNARRTDPVSSHMAYQAAKASGSIDNHYNRTLEALKNNNGATGAELAKVTGIEVHETRKRLNDMPGKGDARRGDMRKCKVAKRLVQTWWVL